MSDMTKKYKGDCTNQGCTPHADCCCCFPLHTGVLLIALLDLFMGAYNFWQGIQFIEYMSSDKVSEYGYHYDSGATWVYIIFFAITYGIYIFIMGCYGVMAANQFSLPHAIRFHQMRSGYLVWTFLHFIWDVVFLYLTFGALEVGLTIVVSFLAFFFQFIGG